MQDLRSVLTEKQLQALRAGYSHDALLKADLEAVARVAPQFVGWNSAIAETFYDAKAPLKPIDRERVLIALITTSGAPLSLAIHVYWGLMEGLGVEEITHILALAGCYGGLPRSMFGIETAFRALRALAAIDVTGATDPSIAIRALLTEFSRA